MHFHYGIRVNGVSTKVKSLDTTRRRQPINYHRAISSNLTILRVDGIVPDLYRHLEQ